jgi:16S rRNA (guanine527-N7)-methyltransferase
LTAEAGDRLDQLRERYALPADAAPRFSALLDLVAAESASITSVRDPRLAVDVHVADSLVALELDVVRQAGRIADLGSGAGFPGLALAIALPSTHVALVESVGRKSAFLARAVEALGLRNVEIVPARAEAWKDGLNANDVITARALAPLAVLLEYAAPLLVLGGMLVAWKTALDGGEEADAGVAAAEVGMSDPVAKRVRPFRGAGARNLYLSLKVKATPPIYPRRPGMARKRPLQASS